MANSAAGARRLAAAVTVYVRGELLQDEETRGDRGEWEDMTWRRRRGGHKRVEKRGKAS